MKKIFSPSVYIFLLSFIMLCLNGLQLFAQDSAASGSSSQTTTTTVEHASSVQPWVWVVGGVVLLLIIIALVRGKGSPSSRTDKVTYTKTTSSEDNS
jgi:hypothetical protein